MYTVPLWCATISSSLQPILPIRPFVDHPPGRVAAPECHSRAAGGITRADASMGGPLQRACRFSSMRHVTLPRTESWECSTWRLRFGSGLHVAPLLQTSGCTNVALGRNPTTFVLAGAGASTRLALS